MLLFAALSNTLTKLLLTEKRRYFCGRAAGTVPDQPIAIIVPVSLVAQWLAELRIFIGPKNMEVYVFPAAAAEWASFWEPLSPWNISKQPMHLRIILFQHSVCRSTSIPYQLRC